MHRHLQADIEWVVSRLKSFIGLDHVRARKEDTVETPCRAVGGGTSGSVTNCETLGEHRADTLAKPPDLTRVGSSPKTRHCRLRGIALGRLSFWLKPHHERRICTHFSLNTIRKSSCFLSAAVSDSQQPDGDIPSRELRLNMQQPYSSLFFEGQHYQSDCNSSTTPNESDAQK